MLIIFPLAILVLTIYHQYMKIATSANGVSNGVHLLAKIKNAKNDVLLIQLYVKKKFFLRDMSRNK